MLLVLLSWVCITLIVFSFGDMFINGWNKILKKEDAYSFSDTFWIGIATVSLVITIVSLVAPLNLSVLSIISLIAIFYLFVKRRNLKIWINHLSEKIKAQPIWVKFALLISFLFILIYTTATPLFYDLGLYHLQSMMWSEQYSVVPGLGNVHGRLAFNSSFLLLSTLFNYHPDAWMRFFSINGLCMLIFTWWVIIQISRSKSYLHTIAWGVLYILFGLEFFTSLSSTSTDMLVNILVVYLIMSSLCESGKINNKILLYSIIPIFCITLKLSSGILFIFILIVLIRLIKAKEYKSIGAIVTLGILIIVPWCARFVILSGYLIYPLPAIDIFTFDWKMPIDILELEKDSAYAWARLPFHTVSIQEVLNMSYFDIWKSWFGFLPHRVFFTYTIGLISPILIIPIVRKFVRSPYLIAWIVAYAGTIFGFVTAPCLRFTVGFIVCSICIPLFIYGDILINFTTEKTTKRLSEIVSYSFMLILCFFVILSVRNLYFFKESEETPMYTHLLRPQSIDYMKKEAGTSFSEHPIGQTIIYSPNNEVRCFDQCLPCTPYFNSRIEMRGETLQGGFRIR